MKTKLLFVLLLITSMSFSQIYVNANALGANDGSSWNNAYIELTTALRFASTGDEIWIAAGTYRPNDDNVNDLGRVQIFSVNKDELKLYGGFAGNETLKSDRDMTLIHSTNATILSGDLQRNDSGAASFSNTSYNDNCYTVVEVGGQNVIISDVTITGGNANSFTDNIVGFKYGGAIYAVPNTSNLTVENLIIKNNIAEVGAGIMYSPSNNSLIKINRCVFDNNISRYSAGLNIAPGAGVLLEAEITNNLFVNNRTEDVASRDGLGGAAGWIRSYFNGTTVNATIVNNTFVNNSSEGSRVTSDFPALGCSEPSSTSSSLNVTAANNLFWGNTTNANAIANAFGGVVDDTTLSGSSIFNSIDEVGFSNLSGTTNTNDSNPNLTADFKLQSSSSAAINQGDNSYLPSGSTLDLEGNNRLVNSTVDIGAYEYQQGTTCIVNIPDATFKTLLLSNNAINTNQNNEIECSEAIAFTGEININGTNVSDITGIEAFTSATEFDFGNTLVTSADFSYQNALDRIWAIATPITNIDVSGAVNLTELVINSTPITTLDISANTKLETLLANNGSLTSIDLSNQPNVQFLGFLDCDLTSLDVSSASQLLQLNCKANNLTSLNVANGNNGLINFFDVSGNPNLSCINIDSNFTPPGSWSKDATAVYSDNCTSLSVVDYNTLEEHVQIFPNPVYSILNIESKVKLERVEVFSVLGRQVFTSNATKLIDVSGLEPAIYFIKIYSESGIVTKRFIKR